MVGRSGKKCGWVWCVILSVFLAASCAASQEIQVGQRQNNGQVELEKGQILTVTLDSNPTTGYRWELLQLDATLLQQVGQSDYKPAAPVAPGMVGRGGTETFRFQAAGPGSGSLKLGYRRPWEKGVEPVKIYMLGITVR
jgi:inhibitor of cysteine peptidase